MADRNSERRKRYEQAFQRMRDYGTTSEELKSWCANETVCQSDEDELSEILESVDGQVITLH